MPKEIVAIVLKLDVHEILLSTFHLLVLRRFVVVLVHNLADYFHPVGDHVLRLTRVQRLDDVSLPSACGLTEPGVMPSD